MVSAQNKWGRRRKIALADLIDEPWVLPSAETVVGMDIAKVFRASGLEPPVAHVASFSIPLHYHLLATDRLITMLPLSMTVFGSGSANRLCIVGWKRWRSDFSPTPEAAPYRLPTDRAGRTYAPYASTP